VGRRLSHSLRSLPVTHSDPSTTSKSLREELAGLLLLKKGSCPQELQERFEELARFRTMIDSCNDSIFLLDVPSGAIVDANRTACRLFGLPREKLLGTLVKSLVHPYLWNELDALFRDEAPFSEKRKTITAEIAVPGRKITAESIVWLNLFSNTVYASLVLRDITPQKMIEERLRHSEKMEIIGRLAGGIAHDFNNLLGSILGFADMLRLSLPEDSQQRKCAEKICQASKRAAGLTSQLLMFSRKKSEDELELLDVHDVLGKALSNLEQSPGNPSMLQVDLAAQRTFVAGGYQDLQNAFFILASHARDAVKELGGQVIVATANLEIDEADCRSYAGELSPGQHIRITVGDSGPGMDKHTLSHIFEPFFSTKELGKGTGMGLAEAYGCITAMNGVIQAESEAGRGTTFTIILPLAVELPQEPDISSDQHAAKQHFLVVDDEDEFREMAVMMLEGLGYKVSSCASGAQALSYYAAHRDSIDIVLLDKYMPGQDGCETFMQLKAIDPALKALMISGYMLDEESRTLMAAGLLGVLQKPFNVEQLAEVLSRVLPEAAKA